MEQLFASLACFITAIIDYKLNSEENTLTEVSKKKKAVAFFNFFIQHILIVFTSSLLIVHDFSTVIAEETNNELFESRIFKIVFQLVLLLIIGIVYTYIKKVIFKHSKNEDINSRQNIKTIISNFCILIVFIISFFIIFFTNLFTNILNCDHIIREIYLRYFINASNNGVSFYVKTVFYLFIPLILFSAITFEIIFTKRKIGISRYYSISEKRKRIISIIIAYIMFFSSVLYFGTSFNTKNTFYQFFLKSDFIVDNYEKPTSSTISFPSRKRNLIHIYLESFENSFLSKELGGNIDVNLMPELTELANEGYVFSDTSRKFGGPQEMTGTTWSIASMVNQTSGIPMIMPDCGNYYGSADKFLPNTLTLMDILTEQGYEQTVMFGADGNSGSLKYYFTNHGNTTVFDLGYARRNGLVPDNYNVWLGFEDDKLYEFAKDEITRLYETGKPFNFTMETADTHRPGGYLSKNAPRPYESSYANAIAYSSSQVVEFVRWIQEQPFYDNTTIILIGDHLSMDTDFFEEYGFTDDYDRSTFNLILNPAPNVDVSNERIFHNRLWSNVDMFPTILASMGVEIEGERLGIGTNLFSGKSTIIDEYGLEYVNNEIMKNNSYYDNE